jgi:hypothetical protein
MKGNEVVLLSTDRVKGIIFYFWLVTFNQSMINLDGYV